MRATRYWKLATALLLGILALATRAEAVTTSYCQSTYVDGNLCTVRCQYWIDTEPAGSIFINYNC